MLCVRDVPVLIFSEIGKSIKHKHDIFVLCRTILDGNKLGCEMSLEMCARVALWVRDSVQFDLLPTCLYNFGQRATYCTDRGTKYWDKVDEAVKQCIDKSKTPKELAEFVVLLRQSSFS